MSTIESKFNGYPAITDWDKAIFVLQQANSQGFNGATKKEVFQELFGDVVIQGAGYEDLPIAESSDPVPLPIPEAEQRFGFLANGKYTQPNGPTLEYSATQWGLVLFDNDKWIKKFTFELPKGKDGIDGKDGIQKEDVIELLSGEEKNDLFPDADLPVRRYTSDIAFTDYTAGYYQTSEADGLKMAIPSAGSEANTHWVNTKHVLKKFRVNINITELTGTGIRIGVGYKKSTGGFEGFHLSSVGQLSRITNFTAVSLGTMITTYTVGDKISFVVSGINFQIYKNDVLVHSRTINNDDFDGELCVVQRSFPKYIFNVEYYVDPVGDRLNPEVVRIDDLYNKNTNTNSRITDVEGRMNKAFVAVTLNLSPTNRAIRIVGGTTVNPTTSVDATAMLDFIDVIPGETIYISGRFSLSYGVCGYLEDGTFTTVLMANNAGAVVNIEVAVDKPLVIPAGVVKLKGCTLNKTDNPFTIKRFKDISEILGNQDDLTQDHLIFEKIDNLSFNLHSYYASKNKYLKHTFVRDIKINSVASGPNVFPDVLTNDVWREAEVFDYNQRIAQGSINFIHRNLWNLNENTHIGSNHGCEVQKWTKMFLDGQEIDFNTITSGDKIKCSSFNIVFKADIYACNASISIASDNALPKMNTDGTPVIADSHYLNAIYTADHKTIYRNTLIVGRDNTKYGALYATMQSCYRPHFNMVQLTNNDSTLNRHEVVDGVLTITPIQSDINLSNSTRGYADTVIQWGQQYKIKSRIINQDNSRQGKVNFHCYFGYPSPNWLKVYLYADMCADNPELLTSLARIFNKGERIDVIVEREILL